MPEIGTYTYGSDKIELNVGQPRVTLTVHNTGDRAIQVGSHYHFFEINRAMSFDREQAFGKRLDIPAGTAVRFEPGDTREVALVEYGGGLRIVGFGGLLNGSVRSRTAQIRALSRLAKYGYLDVPEESHPKSAKTGKAAKSSRSTKKKKG